MSQNNFITDAIIDSKTIAIGSRVTHSLLIFVFIEDQGRAVFVR